MLLRDWSRRHRRPRTLGAQLLIDPPRPLTAAERTILGLLLSSDFPDANALRTQAESAMVVGRCDCPCPTIDLQVAADAPIASGLVSGLAPAELEVTAENDEPPAQIILFVREGRLSCLEYVTFGETIPTGWPTSDRIQITPNHQSDR